MSIGKWRFSSSRKQSTSSSGNCDTATTTTMTSSSSTPRTSTPTSAGGNSNRSSKTSLSSSPFSWFRSPHHRSKKRKSTISPDDPAFARLHKPFTPQNLEHQKLLNTFEWNFGGNDNDDDYDDGRRRRRSSLSISPCATRNTTVDDCAHGGCDYGYGPAEQYRRHHMLPIADPQDALSSSLARLSMREAPGGKHDRANAA
ncbi:hypothetical protein F4823DRAFT_306015 [Ustulina deusta]|nr:hypothetical protein F4823DRAFT_306015 [Ustulina deusta]